MEWLKTVGQAIGKAAKEVIGFFGSSQVQSIEAQAANVAELLFPVEAPLIQTFQGVMGRIFQQAVVAETSAANISSASGTQKLAAVVGEIGPELDAWVSNNFPGAKTISADVKNGLVNAIVALQKALPAPTSVAVAAPPVPQPAK